MPHAASEPPEPPEVPESSEPSEPPEPSGPSGPPVPRPADTREITAAMNLALRIGELLLSSGAGAGDVSAAMRNVAWACGLRRYTADVMFTELTMSHQP